MSKGFLYVVPGSGDRASGAHANADRDRVDLAALAAIDRARLERMFSDHHVLIWRTLRRRGLDAETAADATQQTFLIAAESNLQTALKTFIEQEPPK